MKVEVKNIKWCIEREDVEFLLEYDPKHDLDKCIKEIKESLPTEVVLEVEDENEIANTLSDKYGWLVESCEYDLTEK